MVCSLGISILAEDFSLGMRFVLLALLVAFVATAGAQTSPPPALPTWQDELAKGRVPYHQLTAEDFAINDTAHPKNAFYIKTAIDPRYTFLLKPYNGFVFAYVEQWMVFSGLDKNETSRKSSFKNMKAELPYAQALLDLDEVYARQLAALKPGELPQGRGNSFGEAQADLEKKINAFTASRYTAMNAEMDTFSKETKNGAEKKVRELSAAIRQRLDGTPATTVLFTEADSAPESTPSETEPIKFPPPAP